MDSKLKSMTIFATVSLLVLVLIAVLYVNREQLQKGNTNDKTVETEATTVLDGSASDPLKGTQIGDNLSAFMQDEEFFDKEKTKFEKYLEERNQLSMIVTSVEKDLRIKIINADEQVVTGQKFVVALQDKGEYSDEDEDGIIYISRLHAGDYYVTINPMEGYGVPESPLKVNVKDQVEYVAIPDISMLIKTEDQIDPKVEDTQVQDALDDADKSEIKKMQANLENGKVGIDVSKWNKEIDWDKAKKAGVEFAIIRVGYRGSSTGSLVIDPYFEQNIEGASKAGIKVGVYFFTQAINEVEAVEEASMVLSLIKNYQLDYPVFIDSESAGENGRANGLEAPLRTSICNAFCNTIENAGYSSGVYASRNWFNKRLETASLEQHAIWLAEYRSEPLYQGYYNMWQYTSKGKVDGIEGNVDINISYLEEE